MANCHLRFQEFNGNLNVTNTKKGRLISAKNNLRDKIRKYFREKHKEYQPYFRIQGSYSLGTMIRTKQNTCDLDDGIYFFPKPDETPTTIQKWVWEAVEGATEEKPEHRKKCIRVIYKGDYHIDLPVYYKEDKESDTENPHIAVKNNGWQKSDPEEFKDWFKGKRDEGGQLVRVVRYLKAWCDNRPQKMPSGLMMSVLASNNIVSNERDDVALHDTLEAIRTILKTEWSCIMPTTPQDNLLLNYTGYKDYFFESIDKFINDASVAIENEKNQLKATKLWQKHLGKYFPDGEDANVDEKIRQLLGKASVLSIGKAETTKGGVIVGSGLGVVANQAHKFYGDEKKK